MGFSSRDLWGHLSDYKPTYQIGDEVKGTWNGIPFKGVVGNDTIVNEREGPYITVHLYLPIVRDGYKNEYIIAYHDYVERMVYS